MEVVNVTRGSPDQIPQRDCQSAAKQSDCLASGNTHENSKTGRFNGAKLGKFRHVSLRERLRDGNQSDLETDAQYCGLR